MKRFLDEDFLLQTETARELFKHVNYLPIIDYHCHLNPQEIAENKSFSNMTELWLNGDHYKWRVMRAVGIEEMYITGGAGDYERFEKWAQTIEYCIGNPLYHWTHLELKRCFGYDGILSKKKAAQVWEHCNKILAAGDFNVKTILKKFNVESLCTTDDPTDTLEYHKQIEKNMEFSTKVLPTFRPPAALAVDSDGWMEYIKKLEKASGVTVTDYDTLLDAMAERIDYFHEQGCRLSDHSLEPPVFYAYTRGQLNEIVRKAQSNVDNALSVEDALRFKTGLLVDLGGLYAKKGWAMQLHIGALRSGNTKMVKQLGPDTGYDSMADDVYGRALASVLDEIEVKYGLPKTILYCLNPRDNELLATLAGSFQGGGVKGKIQFGSGWWYNDHRDGMKRQMLTLASMGVLSVFVGMLTDSRSFLSYPRHEYFRRIMCNLLGNLVENGEYPYSQIDKLKEIAADISYNNAKEYFDF